MPWPRAEGPHAGRIHRWALRADRWSRESFLEQVAWERWLRIRQLKVEALKPQLGRSPLTHWAVSSALWPQFCHLQYGHDLDSVKALPALGFSHPDSWQLGRQSTSRGRVPAVGGGAAVPSNLLSECAGLGWSPSLPSAAVTRKGRRDAPERRREGIRILRRGQLIAWGRRWPGG